MSETPWPARGCELYGHKYLGHRPCGGCGAPYVELNDIEKRIAAAVKYHLHDEAGRDQHAEEVGRNIARALGLTLERRTLADGYGGISTNYKTGEVTTSSRPCTVQERWVTGWQTTTPPIERFGLKLDRAAFDDLRKRLDRITEAEHRANEL